MLLVSQFAGIISKSKFNNYFQPFCNIRAQHSNSKNMVHETTLIKKTSLPNIWMLVLLILLNLFCFAQGLSTTYASCSVTKSHFSSLGFGLEHHLPNGSIHDPDMEICYNGERNPTTTSCCTRKMEKKYHQRASSELVDTLRLTTSFLKTLLENTTSYYQDYFFTSLHSARNRTETLLTDVHALPLPDRHGLLSDLFLDLDAFMNHKQVDLHASTVTFFDRLFPLVFHNILSDPTTTTLTASYRECLMGQRSQLYPTPFGESPRRLAHGFYRALTEARTLLDALAVGVDVVNTTDHLAHESQCVRALTRLQYCSVCHGVDVEQVRPCRGYCYNVMRGCLAEVATIDSHWNGFVDALRRLTMYSRGTYDFEQIMKRVHSYVSEAIMHAMETGHKFYSQIIRACGQPAASAYHNTAASQQPLPASLHRHTSASTLTLLPYTEEVDLANRMEAFIRNLLASKGFYHNLADTVCSTEKYATGMDQRNCWQGHQVTRYNSPVIAVDLQEQLQSNPELHVTRTHQQAIDTINTKLDRIVELIEEKISPDSSGGSSGREGRIGGSMQSDEYRGASPKASRYSSHSYSPYYGSAKIVAGSGDGRMDDEDYNDIQADWSGSGSGGGPTGNQRQYQQYGGYNGYHTPNQHRPIDNDIFIDDDPTKRTYQYPTSRPDTRQGDFPGSGAIFTHNRHHHQVYMLLLTVCTCTLAAVRLITHQH